MTLKHHSISIKVGSEEIYLETGKIARQANGAVVLRSGETTILATACFTPEATPNIDFLPLRVDYQEKFSAAGKTLGGFIKREGRPTERETLISRLVDRPIRPMIADGWHHDTQILTYVWSYDGVNTPEPLAICAASAALAISEIPLQKPLGAVRVGFVDGSFLVNPSPEKMQNSKLDLMLAGTEDAVLMIEGYCNFLTEEQVLEAIEIGHKEIQHICHAINSWAKEVGKPKKMDSLKLPPQELYDIVDSLMNKRIIPALKIADKKQRETALAEIRQHVRETLTPANEEAKFTPTDISTTIKKVESKYIRKMILDEGIRSDGRKTKDIRPIFIEQAVLPRTHGSSLFTRGETQSVAVCTLGGDNMAQRFETILEEGTSHFYLQYFFPPFSVGEVGRQGPPGRREVGHGKLAERSLLPILPEKKDFPYTIRVESNITESNGSSSMASVCGGCLALMDAGVPIKRPVSGIAMGLILEDDRFEILSDILGIEDALGDMDFKVSGDHQGITAFQMDIKAEGITLEIMKAALAQAKEGRVHILKKMLEAAPEPRAEMSMYAPRIETLKVKSSKIGVIVGPGGKQIRSIIEETGVEINIDDDGLVSISSPNLERIQKAKEIIAGLIADVEEGKTYTGRVTSVKDFGAFVEILPKKEGLCHISEYDHFHIDKIENYVKQGDTITVKVLEINDRGQIRLSRKATLKSK